MITILAFGKIAEITGKPTWEEEDIEDSTAFERRLRERFPQLENIPFIIAIDKIKARPGDPVHSGATIAILPPFSGG